MLAFRWSGGAGEGGTVEVRPVGVEQSNSSIVFGEALILKAFRRVEPGVNPELELLRFLSERDFPHIAPIAGWYQYDGPADGRDARRAAGVPGRRDRRLGPRARRARRRPRGVPRARCTRSAWSPASCTRRSARTASDPAFAPEEPSTEAISILTATIDEEIERIFVELPEDEAIDADPRPRPGRAGAAAGARLGGRRRARDPHPRRLPPRPDHARRARLGDPRLRGRAGAADVRSGG